MRRAHIVAYFLIAFAFLYVRTFLLPGVPLAASGDGTMFFAHGIRLLHGQVPYVDYENFVMPGCDLFYAAAFYLFGIHAWLAQGFLVLLGISIAGLLLWISSYILDSRTAFLPGLLFLAWNSTIILDATHHWYSDAFLLAAVAILLGGRQRWRLITAGGMCGIAAVFTQSQGLLGFLVIAGWLWWTNADRVAARVQQLLAFILPFGAVTGGVLAWLISRSGFATIQFSFVTFVFHYFPTLLVHTPHAYFFNRPTKLGWIPYLFVHLMLPFGYLWALVRLWRERITVERRHWNAILLVTLTGLALFAAVANAPTPARMLMVAPPATIVCVWLLREIRIRRVLWAIAGIGLVILPIQTQRHWRGYLDLPYGHTAYLQQNEFAKAQWFAEHTHAGEAAFTLPRTNFQFGLENPTPLDFVLPAEYTTTSQVQRVIEGLETHRAPLVVLPVIQEEIRAPGHPGNNLAPLIAYVQANYHQTNTFADCQIWERNGP